MTESDLEQKLLKTFERAGRRHGIDMRMNDAEHRQRIEIRQHHKTLRIQAERAYRDEYPSLVSKETQRLMRQDGSKTREHKPRFGMDDRFNGGTFNFKAETNVRGYHKIMMANLREAEHQDMEKFYAQVEKRTNQKGRAKADFNQATDRRKTADRRQMNRLKGPER